MKEISIPILYNFFSFDEHLYIFKLQGASMKQRLESEEDTNGLVTRILNLIEDAKPFSSRPILPSYPPLTNTARAIEGTQYC